MYGWIWRKLPFGLPGKIIGSLGLVFGAAALLWYVAFPGLRDHLPWTQVELAPSDGGGGGGGGETDQQDRPDEPSFAPEDFETAAPPPDGEDGEDGGDGEPDETG